MKKISYILLIVIFGCQSPNEKLIQENKSLIQHNESLKKGRESVSEMNFKLQKENEALRKLIPILDFSSKSIVSDTLAKTIYNNLVDEPNDLTNTTEYQFLYNLSDLVNPNRNNSQSEFNIENLIETPSFNTYLHYLWRTIDRSPENIKYLFDQNKEYAYVLLKTGNSYKTSGFERTIKILILGYEEIHQNEKLLKELTTRSKTIGVLADTIYQKIESQEMKVLISKFRDADFVSYTHWVYSFWARRNKENNSEIVYQIIKEFDNEMSKYSYVEDDIEEDVYYEEGF